MKQWMYWVLILVAAFLEGSITTLPLVLLVSLVSYIRIREPFVFAGAFLGGFIVDILLLRTIGLTSLFCVAALFLVILYEKKFEIETLPFIGISSFLGSIFFFLVLTTQYLFVQAIISCIFATVLFGLLPASFKTTQQNNRALSPNVL